MHQDNPAARLLAVLVAGKKIRREEICRQVWHKLLEVPQSDPALMVSRLGKLMALPQEIIQLTREAFPERPPTWHHWSGQVDAGFSNQNLNGHWLSFIDQIDDHTITYLTLAADNLDARASVRPLQKGAIDQLRATVADLLNSAIDSDLPVEVKKEVLRHLRNIAICLEEYQITGALPLLDAIEAPIGHACVSPNFRSFLKDHAVGQRVAEFLGVAANVVAVATGIPQLSVSFLALTEGS